VSFFCDVSLRELRIFTSCAALKITFRENMNLKISIALLIFLFSFGAVPKVIKPDIINFEGTYVARDTIAFDKSKKKEITVKLLKFNKNGRIQISKEIVYNEGGFELTNTTILKYLDNFSSYNFTLKNSKLKIECSKSYGKKQLTDFATPRYNKISETFNIQANTIRRKNKSNKNFSKIYILDTTLTRNHKNIKVGNGC
jgi:hypothetical protein